MSRIRVLKVRKTATAKFNKGDKVKIVDNYLSGFSSGPSVGTVCTVTSGGDAIISIKSPGFSAKCWMTDINGNATVVKV